MRPILAFLVVASISAGCTTGLEDRTGPLSTPNTSRITTAALAAALSDQRPPDTGTHSTKAAMRRLCPDHGNPSSSDLEEAGDDVPGVAQVQGWVEQARGLKFKHPVRLDAVSESELDELLREELKVSPERRATLRQESEWLQTIGALPRGTDLLAESRKFLVGQVLAFYQPLTETLVIPTSGREGKSNTYILAHELVHAIDDQHFNLTALHSSSDRCRQDGGAAIRALTEGNAVAVSNKAAITVFPENERRALRRSLGDSLDDSAADEAPSFIRNSQIWPYLAGDNFVREVNTRKGGIDEVFRHPPVSTEQIIHPELYPDELPIAANVPDFGVVLGTGWAEVAAMDVGEADVTLLLAEHISVTDANDAAAGWGGGTVRVWRKGNTHIVVMDLIFDTDDDATQYAVAMNRFIDEAELHSEVIPQSSTRVRTVFSDDEGSLAKVLPHAY